MTDPKFPRMFGPSVSLAVLGDQDGMMINFCTSKTEVHDTEYISMEAAKALINEARAEAYDDAAKDIERLAEKLELDYSMDCSCWNDVSWLSADIKTKAAELRGKG